MLQDEAEAELLEGLVIEGKRNGIGIQLRQGIGVIIKVRGGARRHHGRVEVVIEGVGEA